jgi:aconitase B
MAAVTKGTLHPVSPPGYEVNDKGQAAAAITKGDLLVITSATPGLGYDKVFDKAAAGAIDVDGIALMDAVSGRTVEVGIQGEMDGFTSLTPGNKLYPSASVAGGLDTTAPTFYSAATTPAVAVPAGSRIKAITTTRVRYNFL